jgi:8-oxo-dGTP pyrophosphatase MutT (NUDIX family)
MPSFYRDADAPTPNVPRRIGALALIERAGAILVERRSDDAAWGFLAGGVEDETVLEALHREVSEETGLRVTGATLFGIFSDPTRIIAYPDGNVCRVLTIAFRVTLEPGREPILSEESLEFRFVSLEELADLDLWAVQRPIRDAFLASQGDVVVE